MKQKKKLMVQTVFDSLLTIVPFVAKKSVLAHQVHDIWLVLFLICTHLLVFTGKYLPAAIFGI